MTRLRSSWPSVGWRQVFAMGLAVVCSNACAASSGTPFSEDGDDNAVSGAGAGGNPMGPSVDNRDSERVNPGSSKPVVCDPHTGACSCITIGMLGRLPSYGAVPGQDDTAALQAWLNEKSTAAVDVHTRDTELTSAFLHQYDVLILQALEDREGGPYWTYSSSEIDNLQAWVENGGGLVSLMGYGAQSAEIEPTNQLLSFTGMSYNLDDILATCPNDCCYCVGSSVPATGWNSDHPISANITAVGAFHGRSINATQESEIVALQDGDVIGATVQIGQGRVFVFADEWVSYTSQWTGEGVANDCSGDPNNPCYGTSAESIYQVPQFWYNALLWVSGNPECFRIEERSIIL